MISATSNLVILAVAGPVAAVTYALTARLADVMTQMCWQVPDAGLVARVQIGFVGVAQGIVHLGAAVLLGRAYGLPGVAAAAVIGTALVAYPLGAWQLRRVTGLGQAELWRGALGPWSTRAILLLLLGLGVGIAGWRASVWPPLIAAPALGILYVWWMRPLYQDLPLPARLRLVLA